MQDTCAVILAAGEGTRMRSRLAKVLHPLLGRPLICYPVDLCLGLGVKRVLVVVGAGAKGIREALAGRPVEFVEQAEPRGTADAVLQTEVALTDFDGTVLVLAGDAPLLTGASVAGLLDAHRAARAVATVLTARVENPAGYGRILRDRRGWLKRIVEEVEATGREKRVREINTGCYCFASATLFPALKRVPVSAVKGESFLPRVVEVFLRERRRVHTSEAIDPTEVLGINTRADLAAAAALLRRRVHERLMAAGVTLLDPAATYIDSTVEIGPDTVIYPGVMLQGTTKIGKGCVIYAHCRIQDTRLADHVTILDGSVIRESDIGEGCVVGPYAHLRPQSRLRPKAKVGNFCEVKKAEIGAGSKVPHLAYVGDATIGERVNIGAGTITCNYDGFAKHQTVIEDEVFVGSNTNLVAPVTVGKGAIIAAGSTISEPVPPDALAFGRAPQVNKEGRAEATRKKRQAMAPPKSDED
jgi:bifunctional UDP-N-acetylglucosamine pyrophosphorylase/glucosamine-1-phosphate N-acetyltransferase